MLSVILYAQPTNYITDREKNIKKLKITLKSGTVCIGLSID